MSEHKVYTAQEMRELSNRIWDYEKMSSGLELTINNENYVDCEATQNLIAMLRQAADTEEEREANEKVKWSTDKSVNEERDRLISENAKLKMRLAAVVRECENCFMRVELFRVKMVSVTDITRRHNADINDILRAARGEESEVK